jgi:hypothetical protein
MFLLIPGGQKSRLRLLPTRQRELSTLRSVDDRRQTAMRGPEYQRFKNEAACSGVSSSSDLKGEPYLVGSCGLQMTRWKILKCLALPVGQVAGRNQICRMPRNRLCPFCSARRT